MRTSEIRACRAADLFADPRCAELIEAYAEECGNALIGKPAPRLDLYEGIERATLAQCFAAYENGVLCGFALVIAAVVPHYGLRCASLESIFVELGACCGRELMRAVDGFAKAAGCISIFYTAPVNSRLARLLFLLEDEYQLTNHVLCRRLA